jgi:hypothetical protein
MLPYKFNAFIFLLFRNIEWKEAESGRLKDVDPLPPKEDQHSRP